DVLVLSHADLDHVGGLRSVLAAVSAQRSYASFDLDAFLRRDVRVWPGAGDSLPPLPDDRRPCLRGDHWEADGVAFTFLHPAATAGKAGQDRNADSCVLLVQGASHSLLLTGDVGVAQERELAPELPRIDVVMAPHHGSASSSGRDLVTAVAASHVIAQAGHLNRFRHPARAVELRWTRAGATFWRSDRDGAVMARSGPDGLEVRAERERGRRYWHGG
ncbi:ComEC/Rec2 family competence protein, partial [Achromobacter insolitus]|uniref:ComEC/Rec2 family competence protein n=1 Tax=Achromobacter insolitus TaxID=217204 RepID=UPI0027E0376D